MLLGISVQGCVHTTCTAALLLERDSSPPEPISPGTSPPGPLLWPLQSLQIPHFQPWWGSQPFCIGQNKESGYLFFSLINSKLGMLEGWGGREVKLDMWDHRSLQEDWKESCKGFRSA